MGKIKSYFLINNDLCGLMGLECLIYPLPDLINDNDSLCSSTDSLISMTELKSPTRVEIINGQTFFFIEESDEESDDELSD